MFINYFSKIEKSLESLKSSNKDKDKIISKIEENLHWLRVDLNDMHAILLMRQTAMRIKKQNLIAFIGTGQINENGLHAFIHMNQIRKSNTLNQKPELIYIAITKFEYDFLNNYGFDNVFLWNTQSSLSHKLLTAKTIVFSSHMFSAWGRCALSACTSNPTHSIQLWHGLPAKQIGVGVINDNMPFTHYAEIFNDATLRDYVFIENNLPDTHNAYEIAFPNAQLVKTGSIRLHILFDEVYRQNFLKHKNDHSLQDFIKNSTKKYKILYCPTYRENARDTTALFEQCKSLLWASRNVISVAIKLHVATNFNQEQLNTLQRLANDCGHLIIDRFDEVYSSFPDFDAIVTDYSSIRIDFAILGKPIFLYQFDKETYPRKTDVIDIFSELDNVSYHLTNFDCLEGLLRNDEKKTERENLINNRLKNLLYDDSVNKVINNILEIHHSN